MKNTLWTILITTLAVAMAACGKDEEAPTPPKPAEVELSACCTKSLALVAQMPDCCRTGISVAGDWTGCCAVGMAEETLEGEDRADCCEKGKALLDQFEDCCKTTVISGEPDACCAAMPAALLAQASK